MLAAELLLGRALEAAGRLSDALAHLRDGAAMARECDNVVAFVQAALGFENVLFLSNEPVDEGIALLEEARAQPAGGDERDRKSVVSGKSVYGRVDLGGRRIIKKKKKEE